MSRKPEDGHKRKRLSGCGPWVSRETYDTLVLLRARHKCPLGRIIDAAVAFSIASPEFFIETKE